MGGNILDKGKSGQRYKIPETCKSSSIEGKSNSEHSEKNILLLLD